MNTPPDKRSALIDSLREHAAAFAEPRVMKMWDSWRAAIAAGSKASWPRDGFESLIDGVAQDCAAAADALEAAPSTAPAHRMGEFIGPDQPSEIDLLVKASAPSTTRETKPVAWMCMADFVDKARRITEDPDVAAMWGKSLTVIPLYASAPSATRAIGCPLGQCGSAANGGPLCEAGCARQVPQFDYMTLLRDAGYHDAADYLVRKVIEARGTSDGKAATPEAEDQNTGRLHPMYGEPDGPFR